MKLDYALKKSNPRRSLGNLLLMNLTTINYSSQVQQPSPLLHLARELDPSCWMMWPAMALRPGFGTALTLELVFTIVAILKMPASDVKV